MAWTYFASSVLFKPRFFAMFSGYFGLRSTCLGANDRFSHDFVHDVQVTPKIIL